MKYDLTKMNFNSPQQCTCRKKASSENSNLSIKNPKNYFSLQTKIIYLLLKANSYEFLAYLKIT